MRYFNLKTNYGVETVDELNPLDFKTFKEFRRALNALLNDYRLAGMNVYISRRACKDWSKK